MPPALASPPVPSENPSPRNGEAPGGNPFYVTGGTLPPTAPSYISRKADTDLYDALHDGQFCYVLNTRQIGKSSLMIRTVRRLKEDGAAVVVLDLTAVGQNLTAEQWYDGLLVMLGEQLRLEDECDDFWQEQDNLGPMQRFFAALAQVVLVKIRPEQSLILFVDEIDSVRSLPFSADEFFAGIRECYNRRVQSPIYNRVTFCLLGVATPADLITDTRISPFNIGRRVTLRDFNEQEAAPLASGMGPNGKNLLARALYWTGGHPYLTQRLCREISREQAQSVADVDRLCERLFLLKRALDSDDNLSFVQNRMLRSEFPLPDVLDFYGKLRAGQRIKDDETNALCALLRLAGIAAIDERTDLMRLRNRIYATVFDKAWVLKNMPDAELRRQRQAAFTARMQVGGIAAVIVLVMLVMLVQVHKSEQDAKKSEQKAKTQSILANQQKARAILSERQATDSAIVADKARATALEKANEAKAARDLAQKNFETAQNNAVRAQKNANLAQKNAAIARENEEKAIRAEHDSELQKLRADAEARNSSKAAAAARASETKALYQKSLAQSEAKNAKASAAAAKDALYTMSMGYLMQKKRLQDAEDGGDYKAAEELGHVLELQKDYDKAINHYNVALQHNPEDYPIYFDRGFCYAKSLQPDYTSAISDYTKYINWKPGKESADKYFTRASAYWSQADIESKAGSLPAAFKDYAAALKDLATSEQFGFTDADLYDLRSKCRIGLHQYDLAAEAVAPLLTKPNVFVAAEGYLDVAMARQFQGDYRAAVTAFMHYLDVNPNASGTRKLMLACLVRLGDWNSLLIETKRYRTLSATSADPYLWSAYAALYKGDIPGYQTVCQQALTKFGTMDATPANKNLSAWTSALGPGGQTKYAKPLEIANGAVAEAAKLVASSNGKDDKLALGALWANRNTVAALLYRAGRYKESIQLLMDCEAMQRTFEPADRFGDYIFLALATARSGDLTSAASWLTKARAQISNPDIEQQLFLKEADSLIPKAG